MRLKNADRAIISEAKLRFYLLNPANPRNGGKARLFAALGYTAENWPRLATDLRLQHLAEEAIEGRPSIWGRTYVITAPLSGPLGSASIMSVWQIDFGSEVPRFITAHGA